MKILDIIKISNSILELKDDEIKEDRITGKKYLNKLIKENFTYNDDTTEEDTDEYDNSEYNEDEDNEDDEEEHTIDNLYKYYSKVLLLNDRYEKVIKDLTQIEEKENFIIEYLKN